MYDLGSLNTLSTDLSGRLPPVAPVWGLTHGSFKTIHEIIVGLESARSLQVIVAWAAVDHLVVHLDAIMFGDGITAPMDTVWFDVVP